MGRASSKHTEENTSCACRMVCKHVKLVDAWVCGLCLLSGGVLACFCSYLILASARVRFLREKRRSGDARNTKKRAWTISDTGNRDMWPEGHACAYLDEKASG